MQRKGKVTWWLLGAVAMCMTACIPTKATQKAFDEAKDATASAGKEDTVTGGDDIDAAIGDADSVTGDGGLIEEDGIGPVRACKDNLTIKCALNSWKGCVAGQACHFNPKVGKGECRCLPSEPVVEGGECNPFSPTPQCGASEAGAPMRCHPVYRKCTEICGPDQACSNPGVVCDKKKPMPNYPVATGHCLGSCKDSCGGQSKTWSYCFCDNVCMGMGNCCPDFNEACPTVQSSSPCSLWNWNGCAQGESCVPAGSDVGEVSCKTSGKGQPNGSCDKDDLATCSMSPFLGPQVCFEGKCATVCNVNAGVSMCPPYRTCTAIDADGVTMPGDYGVCL